MEADSLVVGSGDTFPDTTRMSHLLAFGPSTKCLLMACSKAGPSKTQTYRSIAAICAHLLHFVESDLVIIEDLIVVHNELVHRINPLNKTAITNPRVIYQLSYVVVSSTHFLG